MTLELQWRNVIVDGQPYWVIRAFALLPKASDSGIMSPPSSPDTIVLFLSIRDDLISPFLIFYMLVIAIPPITPAELQLSALFLMGRFSLSCAMRCARTY